MRKTGFITAGIFLIGLAVLSLSFVKQKDDIQEVSQNYIITRDGENIVSIGDIDRKVHFKSKDASDAIQNALDKLGKTNGGKLEVRQGRYLIRKRLDIPSNITVTGSGRATIFQLDPETSHDDGIIFYALDKDNILLADFTCIGVPGNEASSAVVFEGVGISKIRNVYARDFTAYGFCIQNNSFGVRLENNLTTGNHKAGTLIHLTSRSRGGTFMPNYIDGCISYAENGHGFEFTRAICQNIVNSYVFLAKGHGIYMHGRSTANLISNCRLLCGFQNGITIEDTHEMNISSNIMAWNLGHNLELNHCVWAIVSANEFTDCGGRKEQTYSIYMHNGTKAVNVTGNTIFNWADNNIMKGGIYETDDCFENQITNNIINYYKEFDVKSLGKNSITAYNMGLPHPYVNPGVPNEPGSTPVATTLFMAIDQSREKADEYLESLFGTK